MPLNDPFFNDLDASACYSDGAINPSQILIPQIDADALAEYARSIRKAGKDIGTDGNDILTSWGGLSGAYEAPESERLLSAVDRVATDGDSVETGTDGLATALINFAAEVRAFKSRFHSLRGGATAMRNKINDDEDWQDDEELVEEHNALLDEVNTLNGEWLEAQLECANTISALFDGPSFTTYDGMEGDGYSGNEIPFGFSQIPEGMDMPWGEPQNVSKHWAIDAWDGVADIGIGFVQDVGGVTGTWHDGKWGVPIFGEQGRSNFTGYMEENLEGLSLLTGFYDPTKPEGQQWGVEDFGEWVDNFVPAIREVGQGIVPTDEWDDRPGYVLSQATVNIGLIVGGVALSLTGVGAPVGVPLLLAGLRTGLRGANNVGTMDIPNFHNDTSFHLPGVPNIDMTRVNSGSGSSGGGFWNSLPGGAWLANIADIGETVRNLNNGSSPNQNPPAPSRTPDGSSTPNNDRDPAEQNRSNDDEIDSQVSAAEVDTFLRDVEDYARRHAEDPDVLLEEINRRQGSDIVNAHQTPELVGARAGESPSASHNNTVTNSSGSGGGGSDTPNNRTGTITPETNSSGRGGSGISGGGDSGTGRTGGGNSEGGNGAPSHSTIRENGRNGDQNADADSFVHYGSISNGSPDPFPQYDTSKTNPTDYPHPETVSPEKNKHLWPGKTGLFGRGVDLEPNTRYEIPEGNGRPKSTYYTDDNGKIFEVHTKGGTRGNWNSDLSDPLPNAKFFVDDFVYITDSKGRTAYMEGNLSPTSGLRGRDETDVGHIGRLEYAIANRMSELQFASNPNIPYRTEYETVKWNGGHLAPREHGGIPEKINLASMVENLNKFQGTPDERIRSWRAMELELNQILKDNPGKKIKLQVECIYSNSNIITDTPVGIRVRYTTPSGGVKENYFRNTPPHRIIGRN